MEAIKPSLVKIGASRAARVSKDIGWVSISALNEIFRPLPVCAVERTTKCTDWLYSGHSIGT